MDSTHSSTSISWKRNRWPFWGILLFSVTFLAIFGSALRPSRQFFLREGGEYFYPIYHYIQQQWEQGLFPLWAPHENLGQPLLGDSSNAVLYPLKMIFFLPFEFGTNYKIFILIHFPLAFWGLYKLARRWKLSSKAATLASLVYTFGGPVFSQYANPVFLTGAAWIPWGLFLGESLLKKWSFTNFFLLVLVLSMMILGGDSESVYFLAMLLCFLLFVYYRYKILLPSKPQKSKEGKISLKSRLYVFFSGNIFRLVLIFCTALLLSAIQILPTFEYNIKNEVSFVAKPLSLWEIPDFVLGFSPDQRTNIQEKTEKDLILEGIFCIPIKSDHFHYQQYDKPVPPWRMAELVWPKIGGINHSSTSWMDSILNDSIWSVSYSLGIIPLVLALCAFKFRRKKSLDLDTSHDEVLQIWVSWVLLFSFLAAMGGFGPIWWVRQIRALCHGNPMPLWFLAGDPVGSVYWFLNMLAPGFAIFKFSAKFMLLFSLALALLAGMGLDYTQKVDRVKLLSLFLLFLSAVGALLILSWGRDWIAAIFVDQTGRYGPLIPDDLLRVIVFSFLQTAFILGGLLYAVGYQGEFSSRASMARTFILFLVAIDLIVTSLSYVPTVSAQNYSEKSAVAERIAQDSGEGNKTQSGMEQPSESSVTLPIRYFSYPSFWTPPEYSENGSKERREEIHTWSLRRLYSVMSFFQGNVAPVPAYGVSLQSDLRFLTNNLLWQCRWKGAQYDNVTKMLSWLDIDYVITSGSRSLPGLDFVDGMKGSINEDGSSVCMISAEDQQRLKGESWPLDTTLWKVDQPSSRVRILHGSSEDEKQEKDVNDQSADETDEKLKTPYPFTLNYHSLTGNPLNGESARIVSYNPTQVVIETTLIEPGQIVLADQFFPGWKATIQKLDTEEKESPIPMEVEVQPYEDILRQITIPAAGEWRVIFTYEPNSFRLGRMISFVTLLLLLVFQIACRARSNIAK